MSDAVKKLEQALSDQPANPLRNHQVQEFQGEAQRLQAFVNSPSYVSGDRGAATERYRAVQKTLNDQAAKPVTGAKRDEVSKLAAEVLEQDIRPSLIPQEVMRRNPAGAVGEFMRRENSRTTQHAIQQWKRAQLAIEPDNEDPDLANVERFRPQVHVPGQSATFMANSQIPGHFAQSPAAKENWPLGDPLVETPLKQAQKREMSEAQKAGLAKARAARLAKTSPSA
jgi:hypothetical protein